MVYTPIPTKGLGDILPADNWNSLVENVVSGPIGLATAAGDLFQATGLNAMARVAIGPAASVVRANSTPDGIEYAETLTSTPSDLTDSSDDDKMVQFGVLRTTFLPRLTNVGYRAFTADGSFNWDWNTTVGYIVLSTESPIGIARLSGSDISLGTGTWFGGTSDGSTLWFVNDTTNTAVAYRASDGARLSGSDISLGTGTGAAARRTAPRSVYDNTDTAVPRIRRGASIGIGHIARHRQLVRRPVGRLHALVCQRTDTAVAYRASDGARLSGSDISLGTGTWRGGPSDGSTLWFVNDIPNAVAVAYRASDGARLSGSDISLGTAQLVRRSVGRLHALVCERQPRYGGGVPRIVDRKYDICPGHWRPIDRSGSDWNLNKHAGVSRHHDTATVLIVPVYSPPAASAPEPVAAPRAAGACSNRWVW